MANFYADSYPPSCQEGGITRLSWQVLKERIFISIALLVPFLGTLYAAWSGLGITALNAFLFFSLYLATGFGITVGFHRLFTHNSFRAHWSVRLALGIFGSMSIQGPVFRWCEQHAHHHRYSDKIEDLHTPNQHGEGPWALFRGYMHAHFGWIYTKHQLKTSMYIKKFVHDPVLVFVDKHFVWWVFLSFAFPPLIGGLFTWSLSGAWTAFLWGSLARIFWVHHSTWGVNSWCHVMGSKPFETGDKSGNSFIFGILALGEGWHNNHHAFPGSAQQGFFRWWQIDVSYLLILLLEKIGLVSKVQVPSVKLIEKRRK